MEAPAGLSTGCKSFWAGLLLAFFLACCTLFNHSVQGRSVTLTRLDVGGDPYNQKGWMRATITFNNKSFLTGSVCGQPDPSSYHLTCWTTGWLAVISQGTVATVGFDVDTPEQPVIGNLSCAGKSTLPCTFNMEVKSCDTNLKKVAALSCYWTPGQIAGASAGVLAFIIFCLLVPCICLCCCCCCSRKKKEDYAPLK